MCLLYGTILGMSDLKIVAGIPAKNAAWIADRQIQVLSTFCEAIVISDDQSDDGTYEICEKYPNVEVYRRPPHDWKDRQGNLQRQEILERCYQYDPDYFLFLDADEIPSANFRDWITSGTLDPSINMYTFPWVHLWKDESHYRVDSYHNHNGQLIRWDPDEIGTSYRKGFLVKNVEGVRLKYDVTQHRVRPSNQPINTPEPYCDVEGDPVILHYGKLSDYFRSGDSHRDRAAWDNRFKGSDYNSTLTHHKLSNIETTLRLREVEKRWAWDWEKLSAAQR